MFFLGLFLGVNAREAGAGQCSLEYQGTGLPGGTITQLFNELILSETKRQHRKV